MLPGKTLFSLLLTLQITAYSQHTDWEEFGEMPIPVAGGRAVVHDSKIFIVGGDSCNGMAPIPHIQEFDPLSEKWRIAGQLQAGRSGFVADFSGDSLVVCGGIVGRNDYDGTSLEIWREPRSFVYDRHNFMDRVFATGGVEGRELFLFGGYRNQTDLPDFPYLMIYDMKQKKIALTDSVFPEIPWHQFSAFYRDNYYIFGGTYFGVSRRIYRFNIKTRTMERVMYPEMQESRADAQAVCGPGGTILIIGGYNETSDALASTEIFQVYDVGFSGRPFMPLNRARKGSMAACVENTVYVFGGRDENGNIVETVERILMQDMTHVRMPVTAPVFRLQQNYPNPFNAGTTICFSFDKRSEAVLDIFNLRGEQVRRLFQSTFGPGSYQYTWDGRRENGAILPSDIYFCKLSAEGHSEFKKMILIK